MPVSGLPGVRSREARYDTADWGWFEQVGPLLRLELRQLTDDSRDGLPQHVTWRIRRAPYSVPFRELTDVMPTQSGAVTFAACQQMFRYHPLAVTPSRSMVLRHRTAGFFVLTQLRENLYVLRSWHDRDGLEEEIQPGKPVPDVVRRTVAGCLPVPGTAPCSAGSRAGR